MKTLYMFIMAALLLGGLSLAGCDSAVTPSGDLLTGQTQPLAKHDNIDICHKRDDQGYLLLSVAAKAEPAHRAHGDGRVGDEVPDRPGFVFDERCVAVPVAASCPCFGADDLDAVLWTDWFAYFDEEAVATRATSDFASVCIDPTSSFCGGTYQCALVTDESFLFLDVSAAEALACQELIARQVETQDPAPACVGPRCPGIYAAAPASKATRSHFRDLE